MTIKLNYKIRFCFIELYNNLVINYYIIKIHFNFFVLWQLFNKSSLFFNKRKINVDLRKCILSDMYIYMLNKKDLNLQSFKIYEPQLI